ncbi:MAG: ABC transporter ATP-binding protein [Candidatus Promineofilum sp.]|nr:ABC transporter ATP-binding protein [Promineifilum sp.]
MSNDQQPATPGASVAPMPITVEGVSFTYPSGTHALREVTLRIAPGEAMAIVGENGAGKTTLVKHFNGLLKPSQGRVLVGDWDTREHSVAKTAARVGYVFQNPDDQIVERTVGDEVAFGPKQLGRSEAERTADAAAALALVELEDYTKTHPYDLTAAQRKLVTLASVLAMRTPIVIFDEPTMGQDARGVALIGSIVERLKSEGRTVLTITHDIDFCAAHFERVVVMADGAVLADGAAADVLARADLLATTNVEPPQLVRLAQALGLPRAPLTVEGFVSELVTRHS